MGVVEGIGVIVCVGGMLKGLQEYWLDREEELLDPSPTLSPGAVAMLATWAEAAREPPQTLEPQTLEDWQAAHSLCWQSSGSGSSRERL